MTDRINAVIVGWGNIGKSIKDALAYTLNGDISLLGLVRRKGSTDNPSNLVIKNDIREFGHVDLAFIATPSHIAPETAGSILASGISTVDSYDDHPNIWQVKRQLDTSAKINRAAAVISAGWDPGSDSVLRMLMRVMSPNAEVITTFGPGRSMGHSTTVKSMPGVIDAVSITLPGDTPGLQKRDVYVKAAPNVDRTALEHQIRSHEYFKKDQTRVTFVEDIALHDTMNHGGILTSHSENIAQEYKWHGLNPLGTANIMIGAGRAAVRMARLGNFGAYTLCELPVVSMLKGSSEEVHKLCKY